MTGRLAGQLELGPASQNLFEEDPTFEPGEVDTETEVGRDPERQMVVGVARDVERLRVVEQAQMDLEMCNPYAIEKSEKLISLLSPFTLEQDYPFVESSEWADDIKGQNWKSWNPIHFLNIPLTDETSPENIKTPQRNASWAINELVSTIMFPEPSTGPKVKGFEKSISLRILNHNIGDIH